MAIGTWYAYGSVAAPGAHTSIVSTPINDLVPGIYRVRVNPYVAGGTETTIDNMEIFGTVLTGWPGITQLVVPVSGACVPQEVIVPVGVGGNITVRAHAAAATGTTYSCTLMAEHIGEFPD